MGPKISPIQLHAGYVRLVQAEWRPKQTTKILYLGSEAKLEPGDACLRYWQPR